MSDVHELDYTQLSLFTFCPRKYKYIFRDCLEHAVGNAAVFSSAMVHPAIVGWYKGEEPRWSEWHDTFRHEAKKALDDFYTLARAQEIYDKYTKEFKSDLEEYEIITGEIAGSFLLSNGVDRFISKPDLVLREKASGKVGVLDIKTSKWGFGAELVPFDRQFLGQVMLTNAQWMMKAHAQLLKKETRLTRSYRTVTTDLLEEWEREVELIYEWLDLCIKHNVWPKQAPGSCLAFNSLCEFAELCGMGKLRDAVIEARPKVDSRAYLTQGA